MPKRNSIVDFLKSQNKDSSFASRKKLAATYWITNYTWTAKQNLDLLSQLRDWWTPISENTTPDSSIEENKKVSFEERRKEDLTRVKDRFGLIKNPTAEDIKEYDETGKWGAHLIPKKSFSEKRDKHIKNIIWAFWESFDAATDIQLDKFQQSREDSERELEYYRADFDKITSRRNQDFFTWIALQNKEFSKSLDFVANLWTRTVWALQWFWKSRIVEATKDKIETDTRLKLRFDRGTEDLNLKKERAEARFKLWWERLDKAETQFRKARDTEKKVKWIETAWSITRYYDDLITGKTLSEDQAARRRQNITGGWTGVENIFNY